MTSNNKPKKKMFSLKQLRRCCTSGGSDRSVSVDDGSGSSSGFLAALHDSLSNGTCGGGGGGGGSSSRDFDSSPSSSSSLPWRAGAGAGGGGDFRRSKSSSSSRGLGVVHHKGRRGCGSVRKASSFSMQPDICRFCRELDGLAASPAVAPAAAPQGTGGASGAVASDKKSSPSRGSGSSSAVGGGGGGIIGGSVLPRIKKIVFAKPA